MLKVLKWVQGDFWPGNILVVLDQDRELKNIFVIDWEMSRFGIPGMEVGRLAAELHLCGRLNPVVAEEKSKLVLGAFLKAYASKFAVTEELVRRALTHFGTHLAVIGPTLEWREKEMGREVALDGVNIVVDGYEANIEDLHKSPVGALLGHN